MTGDPGSPGGPGCGFVPAPAGPSPPGAAASTIPPPARDITAVILAGGESTRMGRDKAVLEIGGVTFLARLRRTLEAVAVEVVVSAADAGTYPDGGLKVVADVFRRCGPLAGIHAALAAVGTGRILVVACDMPLVTADACRRLVSGASRAGVTIALCGGRPQPLFGVYPKTLLPELEAALRQGRYSVLDFLRGVEVTVIDPGAAGSTVNVNTPGDYAGLLAAQRDYSTTAPSPLI